MKGLDLKKLLFMNLLFVFPAWGYAATQTASATIASYLAIASVGDIDMGSLSLTAETSATKSFCIASNDTAAGNYKIKFTGDGIGNAFTIKSPTTSQTIPYTVEFNDEDNDSGYISMTSNQVSDTQTTGSIDTDCGANNARIRIRIQKDDVTAVDRGIDYNGVLTIEVLANT